MRSTSIIKSGLTKVDRLFNQLVLVNTAKTRMTDLPKLDRTLVFDSYDGKKVVVKV